MGLKPSNAAIVPACHHPDKVIKQVDTINTLRIRLAMLTAARISRSIGA
jgi:hypothetical protein